MKFKLFIPLILLSGLVFSQVGINKEDPMATLDVAGTVRGGEPLDTIVGDFSIAVGKDVAATKKYSAAFGYKSKATGVSSFAAGGVENAKIDGDDDDEEEIEMPGGIASGVSSISMGAYTIASGLASVALGASSEATNKVSVAIGLGNLSSGDNSIAIGSWTEATGVQSTALGREVKSSGDRSISIGLESQTKGDNSITLGNHLISDNDYEVVLGNYNSITNPDTSLEADNRPIFQLGNGIRIGVDEDTFEEYRNNAMTILGKGWMGIGIIGEEELAKPTEMLDIGSGNVKVRDLPDTGADEFDEIKNVVIDENGILKTTSLAIKVLESSVETDSYLLNDSDETLLVNGSAINTTTVILPDNARNAKKYTIKRIDNSSTVIHVELQDPVNQTLDGSSTTYMISGFMEGITVQFSSELDAWFIVGKF